MKTFQLFAFILAGTTLASPLTVGNSDLSQAGPRQNGLGSPDAESMGPSEPQVPSDMEEPEATYQGPKGSPSVGGNSSDKKALAQKIVGELKNINQELEELKKIQASDSPAGISPESKAPNSLTGPDSESEDLDESGTDGAKPPSGPPAGLRDQEFDQNMASEQDGRPSPPLRQAAPATPEAIDELRSQGPPNGLEDSEAAGTDEYSAESA